MSAASEPSWRVTLADTTLDEREEAAAVEVLRSRWLSAGPRTRRFEMAFAERLSAADAVAVSSGTAALHLATRALGIGAGDEVVMPSLSFVAAAAVVALHGATPVFADVRSDQDLTVDPAGVAKLVTARTRAIVAMHYGGYPADLAALRALADRHGLLLIEDAAHAPVVHSADGVLGTVGDVGCFSFFATKNITTGEGGMVVARDPEVLARVRAMRSHCLTRSTWDRMRSDDTDYDVTGLGLNYRPTELSSAIGLVQLDKLTGERARRRELVGRYRELLTGVAGLGLPFAGRDGDSALHLCPVVLPPGADRARIRKALAAAGVQTSVHYPPTHQFSHYRSRYPATRPLPVTEAVAGRLMSLPLHARMDEADAAYVARSLVEALTRS
ncbi:aminotransferase DegT [Actinoplanes cyaneus]|uniref:Aminotransferase DegT n=1 Tax=Actinoplanes cyaneus TaxID=52696 RepID=A0A919MCB3_9ACTN|nr:DegT/DnrJ/EryC1/StrS family aminotransferase [Actinoplanes cyaneus]MCW2138216.1 dTDP-4-amino-4,6-dideoxygalactose transaminase [Actinoplanes cyaneus]GID70489.1 aminotransferase DegT [Actinoplanes cyaneus]